MQNLNPPEYIVPVPLGVVRLAAEVMLLITETLVTRFNLDKLPLKLGQERISFSVSPRMVKASFSAIRSRSH